jgi:hypothetical protein
MRWIAAANDPDLLRHNPFYSSRCFDVLPKTGFFGDQPLSRRKNNAKYSSRPRQKQSIAHRLPPKARTRQATASSQGYSRVILTQIHPASQTGRETGGDRHRSGVAATGSGVANQGASAHHGEFLEPTRKNRAACTMGSNDRRD